jgi:putative transposase
VLFDAIGTDDDHVHLFVGAEPKNSPSKAMQIIRSIAAKQMFKSFPVSRKEISGERVLERWWIYWYSR